MKSVVVILLLSITASSAFAGRVKGYIRKDGTYVPQHQRSAPDSSKLNNYSTEGNVNPYTGKAGKVSPYAK